MLTSIPQCIGNEPLLTRAAREVGPRTRATATLLGCALALACSAESNAEGIDGRNSSAPGSSSGSGEDEPITATGVGGGSAGSVNGTAGSGGSASAPVVSAESCAAQGPLLVGSTLLRRMSRSQYNNTLADLLEITGDPAANLSPDEKVGPFVNNSRTPITDLLVEQLQESAIATAAQLVGREASVAGCDLAVAGCSESFIEEFGKLAYRRPLEDSEKQSYAALFALGLNEGTEMGFRLVAETMLQSPFFLYHVDVGPQATASDSVSLLTDYELASRLSYFLWDSMPDTELFALAEAGTLSDNAILAQQVARMLDSEKAARTIASFVRQLLRIGDMSSVEKDESLFPGYGPEMRMAMLAETDGFVDSVIRTGDGLMSSLFTSTFSPMQEPLFGIYGMSPPADFNAGQSVELPADERSGLLTRAAFLTTQAHRDQTSPVHRGVTIRENLLCQPLPSPPANVNNVPPAPTEATTTRERFAQHNENVTCASCHRLMDSIGLGFEHYDPIGAYRETDGGQAVDATGELVDVSDDLSGPFDGAIELSEKLAASQDVADCMASQWFRFALGRVESDDDACSLFSIRAGFDGSGHNIRSLIESIVLSNAFRSVRQHETAEPQP